MLGPLDIHGHLLALDVAHDIVRMPRGAAHSSRLDEALGLPAERCVTVTMYEAPAEPPNIMVAVLTSCGARADEALLRDLMGTPTITLASEEQINARTGYAAAHVGPLLMPADIVVLADAALARAADTIVYTATGDDGTVLAIRVADLLRLSGAVTIETPPRITAWV